MVHSKFAIAWKSRPYQNEITQALEQASIPHPLQQVHVVTSCDPSHMYTCTVVCTCSYQACCKRQNSSKLSANYSRVQGDQSSAFPLCVAETSSVW